MAGGEQGSGKRALLGKADCVAGEGVNGERKRPGVADQKAGKRGWG